jgi:segregation and condensation protein B
MENLKNILEALIFVSDKPLELRRIKEILPEADAADILRAIDEIRADHENRGGSFALKEIAGGYQFRTRSAYQEYIRRLVQPKSIRLSKASLETLAIIAYKQPITRVEVDHIRGVDSSNILRLLLERKLIRVLGRREVPGRPLIYVTTRYFLELFELKDLKDLPTPKEIEEMGSDEEPDYEGMPPTKPESASGEGVFGPVGEYPEIDVADKAETLPPPSDETESDEASSDPTPEINSEITPDEGLFEGDANPSDEYPETDVADKAETLPPPSDETGSDEASSDPTPGIGPEIDNDPPDEPEDTESFMDEDPDAV